MTSPDSIVAASPESADLNRLTDPVTNSREELDEAASTFETVTIGVVASDVTEEDLVRLEGRVDDPSLKITVDSTVDISASRALRPDRVRYPATDGEIYEVARVEDQDHPFASGVVKRTVFLEALSGRVELESA